MSGLSVGGGTIPIELDGKQYELVPTLEACIEISKTQGGLNGAVQRVNNLHFETMCMIVGAGLRPDGKPLNARQRDELIPAAIFRTGLFEVAPICIRFCNMIGNGGRPLDAADEADLEDGEDEEDGGPLD